MKSDIAAELRKFAAEMRANIDKSPMRNVFDSPTLGETNTHFGRFENNVTRPIAAEVAKEGTKSLEQREWRVNAVVSYDFAGRLRGWGVGVGARWQSVAAPARMAPRPLHRATRSGRDLDVAPGAAAGRITQSARNRHL